MTKDEEENLYRVIRQVIAATERLNHESTRAIATTLLRINVEILRDYLPETKEKHTILGFMS